MGPSRGGGASWRAMVAASRTPHWSWRATGRWYWRAGVTWLHCAAGLRQRILLRLWRVLPKAKSGETWDTCETLCWDTAGLLLVLLVLPALTLSLRMYKATGFLRSCSPLRGMPSAVWKQGAAHHAGSIGVPPARRPHPRPALTLVLQALLILLRVVGGRLCLGLSLLPGRG